MREAKSDKPIEAYLQPLVAARKPVSRAKHAEINARVAAMAEGRARKKLLKPRKAPPPPNSEPCYFDRAGYAAFLNHWGMELEGFGAPERERIEARLRPYFSGAVMGDEWRSIISALRMARRARERACEVNFPAGHFDRHADNCGPSGW